MRTLTLILLLLIVKPLISQTVSTVSGIQGKTGLTNGSRTVATFNNPHGVEVDKLGNIYIADRYNHCIRKIDTTGNVSTLAGSGLSGYADGQGTLASFKEPWGLTVDDVGNVYVADTKNNRIRKITASGLVSTIAGTGAFGMTDSNNPMLASFGNPTGIAVDKSGTIFVCDHLTHLIRKITPSGKVSTFAGDRNYPQNYGLVDGNGTTAKFYRPYGIDIDSKGNLFIADEWNHAIRMINSSATVTTLAGNGKAGYKDSIGKGASFNFPWDVAVDTVGNVYVADGLSYIIRKISKIQEVTTFAGIPAKTGASDGKANESTFNGATSLSLNSNLGYLIIGDAYNQLIRKITFTPWIKTPEINIKACSCDTLTICESTPVSLIFDGAYDFYDIIVNEVKSFTASQKQVDLPSLSPGNYFIKAKGYKAGFTSSFSNIIKLTVKPTTSFHLNVSPLKNLCVGDTVTLTTSGNNPIRLNTGEMGSSFKISFSGKFYSTSTNECFVTNDTVSLTFNPLPQVVVSYATKSALLIGDSVLLKASGAKKYKWSNQETSERIQVKHSGTYYALGTDSTGCSSTSNKVTLDFKPLPMLDIIHTNGDSFCTGDAIEISANVGKNIQWLKNGQLTGITDSILIVNSPGLYSFQYALTVDRLFFSKAINISENTLPDVAFTFNTIEEKIGKTQMQFSIPSQNKCIFAWKINDIVFNSTTDNIFSYTFTKAGTYNINLMVENEFGCSSSVSKFVTAQIKTELFVPTGFTPNGDGINDEISIRGLSSTDEIDFLIFNEWGEVVFSGNTLNCSWNGTYKSEPANPGNYTYYLKITNDEGTTTHAGIITLIR